jgi:hypothetical protein
VRYASAEARRTALKAAAASLVAERFLLASDAEAYVAGA